MLNIIAPVSTDHKGGLYCSPCKLVFGEWVQDAGELQVQVKCVRCEAEFEHCGCGAIHEDHEHDEYLSNCSNPNPDRDGEDEEDTGHEWLAIGVKCPSCHEPLQMTHVWACGNDKCVEQGVHISPSEQLECVLGHHGPSGIVAALTNGLP